MKRLKMTSQQKESTYRTINTLLLAFITMCFIPAVILLGTINSKLNDLKTGQAVQEEKNRGYESRLTKLEKKHEKIHLKDEL